MSSTDFLGRTIRLKLKCHEMLKWIGMEWNEWMASSFSLTRLGSQSVEAPRSRNCRVKVIITDCLVSLSSVEARDPPNDMPFRYAAWMFLYRTPPPHISSVHENVPQHRPPWTVSSGADWVTDCPTPWLPMYDRGPSEVSFRSWLMGKGFSPDWIWAGFVFSESSFDRLLKYNRAILLTDSATFELPVRVLRH